MLQGPVAERRQKSAARGRPPQLPPGSSAHRRGASLWRPPPRRHTGKAAHTRGQRAHQRHWRHSGPANAQGAHAAVAREAPRQGPPLCPGGGRISPPSRDGLRSPLRLRGATEAGRGGPPPHMCPAPRGPPLHSSLTGKRQGGVAAGTRSRTATEATHAPPGRRPMHPAEDRALRSFQD